MAGAVVSDERREMRGASRALVVVACAVFVLAACTSDSKPKASSSSSAPPTASSAKPSTVIQASDQPRTSGFVGARADVTGLTCAQDGKQWRVGGKVTNPTDSPVDYRIFTSFLDKSNDTAGLLQTDIKSVAGRASQDWSGTLPVSGTDLQCVLRVERTNAGAP